VAGQIGGQGWVRVGFVFGLPPFRPSGASGAVRPSVQSGSAREGPSSSGYVARSKADAKIDFSSSDSLRRPQLEIASVASSSSRLLWRAQGALLFLHSI